MRLAVRFSSGGMPILSFFAVSALAYIPYIISLTAIIMPAATALLVVPTAPSQQQRRRPGRLLEELKFETVALPSLTFHLRMTTSNEHENPSSTNYYDDAVSATPTVTESDDNDAALESTMRVTIDASLSTSIPAEPVAATTAAVTTSPTKKDWFSLWKRRLITQEDLFSVHKLSAVVYTVTSFGIMGTAAGRWLMGRQDLFGTFPDYLEPIMYAFLVSNFIMCTASIRMAFLHRRDDLASRNAFLGTAGSSIFSGYFLLWASPYAPEILTTPVASQIGFGTLVLWNIVSILDTMIRAADLIEGRREIVKKNGTTVMTGGNENASFAVEYLRYILPIAWGLPVVAATGYIDTIAHDHAWLMALFDHVRDKDGHGLQASVFYNNVLASMAAAYGSLFVTLRDKLLISKRIEWVGITLFSVPALIWTIDVSLRILPYAFAGGASPWDAA